MSLKIVGIVDWINGPVVKAVEIHSVEMMELVEIGEERLIGEIIELDGDRATIQVYESTSGLKPGSTVYGTGIPLSVELGPGLIGNIYDGIQRPLKQIHEQTGNFIRKGVKITPLDRQKKWPFVPRVKEGDFVGPGSILGLVRETPLFEHRILVPPQVEGRIEFIRREGEYTIDESIACLRTPGGASGAACASGAGMAGTSGAWGSISGTSGAGISGTSGGAGISGTSGITQVTMVHRWPVRLARPYQLRLMPEEPLITGQRVIDTFFPIAKGGTAGIPGGFGTGKTITQHQLSKWCDADIIVYIGCGERGNEMTGVLMDFPKLMDLKRGRPLLERTILIANTSDMPLAAREASIYTGITIAEYYRDMGYDVALMADSTSRWAEALREISGRLEEMPAEEGFPAYLATRLAKFYERAGRVQAFSGRVGSVSAICAVSPPGGDFSEPVTQHTKRFVRSFWGLNKELASARYFPAIHYMESYSEYLDFIQGWWTREVDPNWKSFRDEAMQVLQQDHKLQRIVKLIGEDALPDAQRLVLEGAKILKNAFLQQSAFDDVDMYSVPRKQFLMLKAIMHFYHRAKDVIKAHIPISKVMQLPIVNEINRMKEKIPNTNCEQFDLLFQRIDQCMDELEKESMAIL